LRYIISPSLIADAAKRDPASNIAFHEFTNEREERTLQLGSLAFDMNSAKLQRYSSSVTRTRNARIEDDRSEIERKEVKTR